MYIIYISVDATTRMREREREGERERERERKGEKIFDWNCGSIGKFGGATRAYVG